jgi:hypothetical protein
MSRLVGSEMPDGLFELMTRKGNRAGKVIVMATVDENGWAHPAMASYYELVARGRGLINLAIGRNSTTERNLERTGAITLVVTDRHVNFYLKGVARKIREQIDETPFSLFQVKLETVLEDQDPAATIVQGIQYEWDQSRKAAQMQAMLDRLYKALEETTT